MKRGVKSKIEEVAKAWKIGDDGLPSCHVGYIAVAMLSQHLPKQFDGIFLRVKRDLRISESCHERQRSHFYQGIIECEVINDNPRYDGHLIFERDPCDISMEDPKVILPYPNSHLSHQPHHLLY